MPKTGKSRIAHIAELFLDAVLLVCFIAQAFLLGCLLIYGYLPLPAKWLNRSINEQLPPGIEINAGNYILALDGSVRAENIELRLQDISQAVFTADYALLELSIQTGGDEGFVKVKECVLSEGTLVLPAVYSPSGRNSLILEHIAMRVVPHDQTINIDSFAALHSDIRLRGSLNLALQEAQDEPIDVRAKADALFKQIAQALKQKTILDGLTRPTILFHIDSGSDRSFNIDSRVSSRAYQGDGIRAKNLTLDAKLAIKDRSLVSQSSVLLRADEVELPQYNTRASYLSAQIERDDWEVLLKGDWPDMEIMAEALNIEGIRLDTPRLNLSPQNFPTVGFTGFTSGLKGVVQFSGTLNAQTRAGFIHAFGSLDLLAVTPENIRNSLPPITVNDAPYYNLDLTFAEGFALQDASLRARVDALELDAIHFDHIRFRADYSDGKFSIDRLYLRRDWQWLDVGFHLDNKSSEYALTLFGFAKPYDYNAILPPWWGGIFTDFDFEKVEDGLGDFVIYGNTEAKAADFFFGHATARNVGFKGVRVDEGDLIVRGRGPYAELHRLNARSGAGYVKGDIRFASRLDEVRGPMSVRLDLETKLPLTDAAKLFDEDIASILADFETDTMPQTTLKGAIFNSAYPEFKDKSYIEVAAACPSPLRFKGIPLDYLDFDLVGRKGITSLRNIRLGYAGGEANAIADILTANDRPAQLRFKASLEGANQAQAVAQLSALGKKQTEEEIESEAQNNGRLDFELHAEGPAQQPLKMKGIGSLKIENEELYAIQLFGPLSRLLQDTRLGFTSFALNELKASFEFEEGNVRFDQFIINGPRSKIEAPGTLQLSDYSLAMRVSVYLFGNAGNPDSNIRKIGEFITKPIPNLLVFELTGTAENQSWRSLYDPRKLIPRF